MAQNSPASATPTVEAGPFASSALLSHAWQVDVDADVDGGQHGEVDKGMRKPLLVCPAMTRPLLHVGAVRFGPAGDVQALAAPFVDPEVEPGHAHPLALPDLGIRAVAGPDLDVGAVRFGPVSDVEALPALGVDQEVELVAEALRRPLLGARAVTGPLLDVGALAGAAASDVETFAAVRGLFIAAVGGEGGFSWEREGDGQDGYGEDKGRSQMRAMHDGLLLEWWLPVGWIQHTGVALKSLGGILALLMF